MISRRTLNAVNEVCKAVRVSGGTPMQLAGLSAGCRSFSSAIFSSCLRL